MRAEKHGPVTAQSVPLWWQSLWYSVLLSFFGSLTVSTIDGTRPSFTFALYSLGRGNSTGRVSPANKKYPKSVEFPRKRHWFWDWTGVGFLRLDFPEISQKLIPEPYKTRWFLTMKSGRWTCWIELWNLHGRIRMEQNISWSILKALGLSAHSNGRNRQEGGRSDKILRARNKL